MILTFSHSGSLGDIIYHLPSMISIAKGKPFNLLLKINVPACYTEPHPSGNVLLTIGGAHSLMKLLELQPYIASCRIWEGERIDVDMDRFRLGNTHQGNIAYWPCMSYLCSPDLSGGWICVGGFAATGRVLLGRTKRYRNPALDFSCVKEASYVGFGMENDSCLPHLLTPTALDLAREIAGCRFFIGNQSFPFALASALNVPRALEVCPWCPNVTCTTTKGVMIWRQDQLEAVVADL